ncbi:MAG: spermidine synthase [Myxococcota bacterium]|jgi:spermidine synthase
MTMDPALSSLRKQRVVAALVPLFLASGATSLVYETLWERQLHLVFGTSQVAVYTVLAAFMCGLAMGGFAAARMLYRVTRPLRVYAILEGCIGLYAVLFPFLLGFLEPAYTGFWAAATPSVLVFAVFQFFVLGLALLPPTMCMGATLPLLVRFAAEGETNAGTSVGRLYGANTLGAVIGVAMAGFVLLPSLGLSTTTWVAAGGNVLLCFGALMLDSRVAPMAEGKAMTRAQLGLDARMLCGIAMIAGLSSLICEVSWFRLMVLILGGSAYAFSIMLLSFLVGIGLGGLGGGVLADKAWAQGGVKRVLKVLAAAQLGVALLTWGVMFTFNELPYAFVWLYDQIDPHLSYLWPAKLMLAMTVMVPPALLMGATFPLLVRALASADALGESTGRLYGWNTVGAILGASVGGLILLPWLQVTGTLLVAISLNLGAALIALRMSSGKLSIGVQAGWGMAWVWVVGLLFFSPPPWEPLLMTAGMYKYVSDLEPEERTRQGVLDFAVTPYELLYYNEGLSSVVTVASSKSGNIWLANNGKVDASTSVDMPTQVLVAHLPYAFKPKPDNVLVIGLASGVTAGSVALHEAPSHIDVVELEPAIVEASHIFDEYNSRPLDDPRVTLHTNDGRNHLTLAAPGTYDLVISEPSNPWLTGVSNLFTKEFFELGKSRLSEGGVWGQWVQMYGMDTEDLRTLIATFLSVYDHVVLFSTIEDADLVLVGSDSPLEPSVAGFGGMIRDEAAVAVDLRLIDCGTAEDLLARIQLDRPRLEGFAEGAVLNTDDNMRIEYSAPLHLHEQTAEANFMALLHRKDGEQPMIPLDAVDGVPGRLKLAEAYARRDDHLRALLVLKDAWRLEPENKRVAELYSEYQEVLTGSLK